MKKNKIINVKGTDIILFSKGSEDYISITDIARFKNKAEPKDVVKNWMRSRTTVEFLGLWEKIHNPNFKGVEFDSFMYEAGSNSFSESINAVFINQRLAQHTRLLQLNHIAITQMKSLLGSSQFKKLK